MLKSDDLINKVRSYNKFLNPETLMSFKRAGASAIVTYYADRIKKIIS